MIQTLTTEILTLTGLVAIVCFALAWAKQRYQPQRDPLVDAIDALLPQTQCAQCGYPGCRPYAEAVANGASIDLCPPGGRDTQQALAVLLGRTAATPLAQPLALKAKIDETSCVGCFLCVEACPVDAIIGAPRYLHTVLEERCTGCELCLPPCPVDCIELIPEQSVPLQSPPLQTPPLQKPPLIETGCIRCNRCEPVCPEGLPVQQLWWFSRSENPSKAREIGLDRCIECGLCNPECPSDLDLVGTFHRAREKLAALDQADASAALARKHVAERGQRLARQALIASDRRSQRLAALKSARHE